MTKKRWIAVLGMLAGLVCLGVFVPALLPPPHGITKANFDRIQEGMSQADVEAIFGEKPPPSPVPCFGCGGWHLESWQAHDGSEFDIHFVFDSVTSKNWTASTESKVEQIRRWLFNLPPPPRQTRLGTNRVQDFPGVFLLVR